MEPFYCLNEAAEFEHKHLFSHLCQIKCNYHVIVIRMFIYHG